LSIMILRARSAGGREHLVAVELPVRVVGRKQQQRVRIEMVDQAADEVGRIRGIERLDGGAEMVAEDVARRALDPRHFGAQAAP
jgi:hypothetical protein